MKLWQRKSKFPTTLPTNHPMNYLNVPVDPVVMYLPVHGQVLMLVEAPAPDFLSLDAIYCEGRRLYALQDVDVIPSAYYKRNEQLNGYVRG